MKNVQAAQGFRQQEFQVLFKSDWLSFNPHKSRGRSVVASPKSKKGPNFFQGYGLLALVIMSHTECLQTCSRLADCTDELPLASNLTFQGHVKLYATWLQLLF